MAPVDAGNQRLAAVATLIGGLIIIALNFRALFLVIAVLQFIGFLYSL